VRPNGTFGFIQSGSLRISATDYHLVVNRHALRLSVWKGCEVKRRYPIGLGTKETPTPVGSFYLASLLKPPRPDTVYGAYAYGLSGYSPVIRKWRWGGIIGLHGTNHPSAVGHYVSHGCIRMRNPAIKQLVRVLPLGTPITIK
jgi:lipoprotein-anchoring transpeptidase ErfK/SrfK